MQRQVCCRVCAYSDVDSSMILITAYDGPAELTSLKIVVIAEESSGSVGADLSERHGRFCYIIAGFWEKISANVDRYEPRHTVQDSAMGG